VCKRSAALRVASSNASSLITSTRKVILKSSRLPYLGLPKWLGVALEIIVSNLIVLEKLPNGFGNKIYNLRGSYRPTIRCFERCGVMFKGSTCSNSRQRLFITKKLNLISKFTNAWRNECWLGSP